VAILDITHHMIYEFFYQNKPETIYKQVSYLKVKSKVTPNTPLHMKITRKNNAENSTSFEIIWQLDESGVRSTAVEIGLVY
jgi:hypothetical protein